MRLDDLFPHLPKKEIAASGAIETTGVSVNSRKIRSGDLFVAIRGSAADGHDYIDDAIANGASAVVAESDVGKKPVPVIIADDTRLELARLSRAFYPGQPGMIAAITGTNGKTSTAEFLRQIWSHIGWRSASLGTLGVIGPVADDLAVPGLTTPDAASLHRVLDRLSRDGISHASMETSSHGLHQKRLAEVKIAVAGFTNLSHEHLDYHADMEDYYRAKAVLFTDLLLEGGTAVINIDSEWGQRLSQDIADRPVHVLTVGENPAADLRIAAIKPYEGGLATTIRYDGLDYTLPLALTGSFQAGNAVLAAAMAPASGPGLDHALMSLSYIRPAPGRMQTIHGHPDGAIVVVDYAHSPDAMETALNSIRPQVRGRLGVVFGCGGDRDRAKRPEMGRIAAELADFVIITDDNPRSEDPGTIRAEIKTACPDAIEQGDRHQAIFDGISMLGSGDILMVAGKGHEALQTIGSETLPFSDEATVRGILANMANASGGAE